MLFQEPADRVVVSHHFRSVSTCFCKHFRSILLLSTHQIHICWTQTLLCFNCIYCHKTQYVDTANKILQNRLKQDWCEIAFRDNRPGIPRSTEELFSIQQGVVAEHDVEQVEFMPADGINLLGYADKASDLRSEGPVFESHHRTRSCYGRYIIKVNMCHVTSERPILTRYQFKVEHKWKNCFLITMWSIYYLYNGMSG